MFTKHYSIVKTDGWYRVRLVVGPNGLYLPLEGRYHTAKEATKSICADDPEAARLRSSVRRLEKEIIELREAAVVRNQYISTLNRRVKQLTKQRDRMLTRNPQSSTPPQQREA